MEIPTSTHPGLISKSQTEEKARFTTAVSKITPVINLIKKMYGKSRLMKFIRTDYSTYKKTQSPIVILDNIKINHPLVKLMADYVKKLDLIGDSSKFFMILVGNILEEVLLLLDRGVKASTLSEILHEISSDVFDLTSDLSDNLEFINNGQINENFLKKVLESLIKEPIPRQLLEEAILKTSSFNLEKIRICKIPSGSLEESQIVNGMIFEREPEGKIKDIKEGSTSIYNAPIDVPRGELKSVVQLESADQLRSFSKDEIIEMKKKISNLKSDVLIFSGRINEIYLDLLNKENKLIFKILSKHDLRRLRDLLGGSISQEFGEEVVKGKVKEIKVITLGNKKYTQFINENDKDGGNKDDGNEVVNKVPNNDKAVNDDAFNKVPNNDNINNSISSKSLNVCSIILRHSLEYRLDDIERNLNKALIALQRNVKNEKLQVCPGKGQFEKRLGEIFFKLSKESLERYNEGEDLLEKHLIYESLYKSMPTNEVKNDSIDIYSTKVKAICYALEFVGTVFEIEDYLIGIPPKLNVRPQMNQDWDEDH